MNLTLHSMSLSHHFCPNKHPKRILSREFPRFLSSAVCFFNFRCLVKKLYFEKNIQKSNMRKFSFLPAAIYALSYEEIQSFGSLDQGRDSRTTPIRLFYN